MFTKIKLGFPNIWLQDSDYFRAIDLITTTLPDRSYYMIYPDKGFCKFIDGSWKPVLVKNPVEEEAEENPYIVTFDSLLAQDYLNTCEDTPKTLFKILPGPFAKDAFYLTNSLLQASNKYRTAFWNDSLEEMPFQTIIISSEDCPDELSHLFHKLDSLYPNSSEFYTIISHINKSSHNRFIDEKDYPAISRSAVGLKESDFISYVLQSISETGTVTAQQINDFKMADIKANGILEIINPKITFNDIGGLDNIKDIIKRVSVLRKDPNVMKDYGITPIRRVLMVGVPGTGKSAICQATSAELGLDLARTGISQVMNSFIGQSEANMRAVFRQIKAMTPVCVWIDEFGRDLSGGSSSSHVDGGTTDRVHGEFLTGLQELPEESFLLCAANDLTSLKPEMLRADRFDKIFFVGLPSHEERKHIFNIHLSGIKTDEAYDYDALAEVTAFMTGAEILTLIKETKFYVVSDTLRPIKTSDIISRAPEMRNTIWRKHPDMIKSMYEYALTQWDWASTSQMEDAKIILGKRSRNSPKLAFN